MLIEHERKVGEISVQKRGDDGERLRVLGAGQRGSRAQGGTRVARLEAS